MSLRVFTGGANAGPSETVRGLARERAGDSFSVVLLVPSAPDASHALTEAAEAGIIGLSVHSFDDYLDEIWRRYGDGRTIVGQAERLAALEESRKYWIPDVLVPQANSRGIIRLMSRLVQRCAESEVPVSEPTGKPVVRDLLAHAREYEALLSRAGLIERSAAHRLGVSLLDHVILPSTIAVDGFTGFTGPQEAFLRKAGERSEVLVALVYEPSTPATGAAQDVIRRLGGTTEGPGGLVSLACPAELQRIATSLGTTGTPDVPASGAVRLSEAWGGAAEAARVAAEVQHALEERCAPGSIAVVFRDLAPYLHDLQSAFREAGIPIEVDATIPLSATPLGRILGLLVRLDSLEHEELMDILRSPYSPAPNDLLDRLDAAVRRRRRRTVGAGAASAWFREEHAETTAFLGRCKRALRATGGESVQREWYALISGMLARAYSVDSPALVTDAVVVREFMEVLRGAVAIREDITTEGLASLIDASVVALSSSGSPEHVQLMSAERVRGRRWECVILGGLTDGVFPRRTAEDFLADSSVVKEFSDAGVDVAPRSGVGEERLLFYQVVTRATRQLVLSRQTHDAEGRPLRPSIFWDELLDLYRDPVTREYYAGELVTRTLGLDELATATDAPRTLRRSLRHAAIQGESAVLTGEAASVLQEAARRAAIRRDALSEMARRVAGERGSFSASEIETYLQCPFQWCVTHLVRPRELDRTFDAATIGRLGHDIMRGFYEEYVRETGALRVTPQTLDLAREVHARVAAACLSGAAPQNVTEELACRTAVMRTRMLVEQDAGFLPGFVPLEHEWSFGIEDGDVAEDLGGFALAGRVDRIDSDGSSVILTDYKSGTIAAEHGAARFIEDGLIQLPLYAAVVSRRLQRPVSAVLYRSFKGGKPRGLVLDVLKSSAFVSTDCRTPDEFQAVLEAGLDRAREAVSGMRSGRVDAEPLGGSCPDYCPARAFCHGWRPRRG